MAAGGEADDADFLRINLPLGSVGADGANRLLGVEERHVRTSGWKTVFEDYAGDAVCVEPGGDAVAFALGHQAAVAAAGADDDRRAVRLLGQVYGDLRF